MCMHGDDVIATGDNYVVLLLWLRHYLQAIFVRLTGNNAATRKNYINTNTPIAIIKQNQSSTGWRKISTIIAVNNV